MSYHIMEFYVTTSGADPGGFQRVPWNPPFERASLTRDTIIEQSNR